MEGMKYTLCDPDTLYRACNKMGWFTAGTNEQYDKLFSMNRDPKSFDAADMMAVIWVCSDGIPMEDISDECSVLFDEYRKRRGKEAQ